MDSDTVVSVTWPQLPQRPVWRNEQQVNQPKPQPYPTNPHTFNVRTSDSTPPPPPANTCEYLDHTADVQLHAWAPTKAEAYASAAVGLHAYMVEAPDISTVSCCDVEASGHDEHSLLFAFLDECLYLFCTEQFVVRRALVQRLDESGAQRVVRAKLWGDFFKPGVHAQGTEVKAITYSNMQVMVKEGVTHLYVIVDI